jgi:hypothetical protein
MLGPGCVLVSRTVRGFRGIDRDEASTIQKCLIDGDRDQNWLFRQCEYIADALNSGEIALAQIYGLYIPIGDLSDRQLRRIALAGLGKAGFNPDQPRVPKGDHGGGEWTDAGGSDIAPDGSAATLDAVTVSEGTSGSDGGPGGADGSPPMEYSIAPGGSDASSGRTLATPETPSNGSEANSPGSPVNNSEIVPVGSIAEADAPSISLVDKLPWETITALTELAARMTAATIVFRILFIPSNGSVVAEGRVANAPDLSYRYDSDTGIVQVWQDDGTGARALLGTGHICADGRFYDESGRGHWARAVKCCRYRSRHPLRVSVTVAN